MRDATGDWPGPRKHPATPALLAAMAGFLGTFVLPAVPTAGAQGFPEPRLAPIDWQFDFDWRMPRRIVLRSPGGEVQAYWYLPYTVTNETEQERAFLPEIKMVTRTGEVLQANDNIPLGVYAAIRQKVPLAGMVPPQEVGGRLLVGEDRARSSVAIWREPMPEMGRFQVFVGGLSGEIEPVTNLEGEPLTNDEGEPILVRKNKRLEFNVRGDQFDTGPDAVELVREDWVMR